MHEGRRLSKADRACHVGVGAGSFQCFAIYGSEVDLAILWLQNG